MGRRWTEQEITYLKKNYSRDNYCEIAVCLDRTPTAILHKAFVFGLMPHKYEDEVGNIYGYLRVIEEAGRYRTQVRWKCLCDKNLGGCGNTTVVLGSKLRRGETRSCGCFQRQRASEAKRLLSSLGNGRHIMRLYKGRAKKKGLEWQLSEEDFFIITSLDCYYCGVSPQNYSEKRPTGSFVYNGIDRQDNSRGYTIDNSVPCCGICNRAKKGKSVKEFLDWLEGLTTRREEMNI